MSSGAYANYQHNYIAKLLQRGFQIDLSQIVPYSDSFDYLQIVGTKPRAP